MDPFKYITFYCHELILNHLSGVDFYKMTKVSKEWEIVVKTDKNAAKKLNATLNLDLVNHEKDEVILELLNGIEYQQLSVESDEIGIKSMKRFSRSLRILSISQSEIDNCIHLCQGLHFPELELLQLEFDSVNFIHWIKKSKFPYLKKLLVSDFTDNDETSSYLLKFSEETPTLATLHLECVELPLELQQKEIRQFSKLSVSDFLPEITYHTSLKILKIFNVYEEDIEMVLKNMKNLDQLTLSYYNGMKQQEFSGTKMFSINQNISSLEIMTGFNESATIDKILRALPSLMSFTSAERVVLPSTVVIISKKSFTFLLFN